MNMKKNSFFIITDKDKMFGKSRQEYDVYCEMLHQFIFWSDIQVPKSIIQYVSYMITKERDKRYKEVMKSYKGVYQAFSEMLRLINQHLFEIWHLEAITASYGDYKEPNSDIVKQVIIFEWNTEEN